MGHSVPLVFQSIKTITSHLSMLDASLRPQFLLHCERSLPYGQLASRCGLSKVLGAPNRKVSLTGFCSVWAGQGSRNNSRAQKGKTLRGCVCGMTPHQLPASWYLRSQGWARILPETCRRCCKDSRKPAEAAKSRKQEHKRLNWQRLWKRSLRPLHRCSDQERQPIRSQMYAGGVPNQPTLPTSLSTPLEPGRVCLRKRSGEEPKGTPGAVLLVHTCERFPRAPTYE
ncbi:UPF0538 protein C2orf76 homolog isoform X1 [Ovis aries]|uniref:UPF0538 protein C2orf76 homolog isoform X1 n=1 Tax=Ovis aries TaxID=9940 RepID=UPI00295284E3|nr:UPF0538 protein C2orf76 homolog isoform X1 [Ovis aries]